jgi:DNA repair protein RecO (recombination protein O)
MAHISDQAIVLRLTDYSESSQIAWLFTHKHGLVRLIAKGTKRSTRSRAAVGLDLLERGELTYLPAKGDAALGTLTDWRQLDAHRACRESLGSLYAALYAIELVTAFAEDSDPAPRLWQLLAELLDALGQSTRVADAVAGFQLSALREFGVLPELCKCVDCGHVPVDLTRCYMSASAGGLLCRDCEASHVEKQAVPAKLLREEVLQEHPGGWFDLLDYFITESLSKPLRSAGMLKTTLRAVR